MIFDFLRVKAVPQLFWSSPRVLTVRPPLISVVFLVCGLVLFGLGEAFLVAAGLGVSPWTVLAQGVVLQTGLSLGWATFWISAAVLALWLPLRQVPGLGTVLNAVIIALVLGWVVPHLPRFPDLISQIAYIVVGVLTTGLGGAIYLIANLGPGPRDGLMTGLQRITGLPIAWVRSGLEISVVVAGVLLGGVFGLGTLLFAFGIGPAVALGLFLCTRAVGVIQTPSQ